MAPALTQRRLPPLRGALLAFAALALCEAAWALGLRLPASLSVGAVAAPVLVAVAAFFGGRQEREPAEPRGRRERVVRWERDLDTFRFTRVSAKATDLLGYTPEEWVDQPYLWIPGIYPDDRQRVVGVYDAVRADGRNRSCDYRVLAADGRFVWLREEITVVPDGAGRPRGYRGTLAEIPQPVAEPAARRPAEAYGVTGPPAAGPPNVAGPPPPVPGPPAPVLAPPPPAPPVTAAAPRTVPAGAPAAPSVREAAVPPETTTPSAPAPTPPPDLTPPSAPTPPPVPPARIADLTTRAPVTDETVTMLANDLRGPVTSILGWVRLLRGGELDDPARARALDTIERSAEVQARLLDALLDLANIERGELQLRVRPVDVALVVQSALDTVRATAAAKGVTVRASVELSVGVLSGDQDRLAEIVSSLLTTAIEVTPKGGRVDVTLQDAAHALRLSVSGGADGIGREGIPRLFDRPAAAFGGRGIRLAIAHHLVELHGGTIGASSGGEDAGLTFTVSLPLAATRAAA